MTNYHERLIIPIGGDPNLVLISIFGEMLSIGYKRIVLGGRGPYVEFTKSQIIKESFKIPDNQRWRLKNPNAYYLEYRSTLDNVKLYWQRKPVDYADYKINHAYISPFDLFLADGRTIITHKKAF